MFDLTAITLDDALYVRIPLFVASGHWPLEPDAVAVKEILYDCNYPFSLNQKDPL